MRASVSTFWKVCLVLVVAALAVRYILHHLPPYEQGFHPETVEAQSRPSAEDGPHIAGCPIFPKDNVWNTPVDRLPRDQHSNAYVESIGVTAKVHPDFGSNPHYGMPYTIIPPGTKPTPVEFAFRDESDLGGYRVPPDAPIEGGGQATGDRHILMIDPRRCILYELLGAYPKPDGSWKADAGIKMDLTSNALRIDGYTSSDAAGLPVLAGLIRYDEVAAGEIRHALRFTVPHTQAAYIWPARHKASRNTDPHLPPLGVRFRLKANFDISGFSKSNQVILKALKRYGMFLADNGGPMFITGVPDKRWDDDDLHKLGNVTADDFEAVDEGDWLMLADSARVDPLELQQENAR